MQRNAQAAYTVLKDAGLHLMKDNWTDGAHFEISLENTKHLDRWIASEGKLPVYWADFYGEIFDMDGSQALNDLLEKHGLYFEWVNAGVIAVYSVYDQ
jgi:hypothetical protein